MLNLPAKLPETLGSQNQESKHETEAPQEINSHLGASNIPLILNPQQQKSREINPEQPNGNPPPSRFSAGAEKYLIQKYKNSNDPAQIANRIGIPLDEFNSIMEKPLEGYKNVLPIKVSMTPPPKEISAGAEVALDELPATVGGSPSENTETFTSERLSATPDPGI